MSTKTTMRHGARKALQDKPDPTFDAVADEGDTYDDGYMDGYKEATRLCALKTASLEMQYNKLVETIASGKAMQPPPPIIVRGRIFDETLDTDKDT